MDFHVKHPLVEFGLLLSKKKKKGGKGKKVNPLLVSVCVSEMHLRLPAEQLDPSCFWGCCESVVLPVPLL